MSDSTMNTPTLPVELEKQWQMPSKQWATPKKPVLNPFDHKRVALYCAPEQQVSAPELAALQLKDQLISA